MPPRQDPTSTSMIDSITIENVARKIQEIHRNPQSHNSIFVPYIRKGRSKSDVRQCLYNVERNMTLEQYTRVEYVNEGPKKPRTALTKRYLIWKLFRETDGWDYGARTVDCSAEESYMGLSKCKDHHITYFEEGRPQNNRAGPKEFHFTLYCEAQITQQQDLQGLIHNLLFDNYESYMGGGGYAHLNHDQTNKTIHIYYNVSMHGGHVQFRCKHGLGIHNASTMCGFTDVNLDYTGIISAVKSKFAIANYPDDFIRSEINAAHKRYQQLFNHLRKSFLHFNFALFGQPRQDVTAIVKEADPTAPANSNFLPDSYTGVFGLLPPSNGSASSIKSHDSQQGLDPARNNARVENKNARHNTKAQMKNGNAAPMKPDTTTQSYVRVFLEEMVKRVKGGLIEFYKPMRFDYIGMSKRMEALKYPANRLADDLTCLDVDIFICSVLVRSLINVNLGVRKNPRPALKAAQDAYSQDYPKIKSLAIGMVKLINANPALKSQTDDAFAQYSDKTSSAAIMKICMVYAKSMMADPDVRVSVHEQCKAALDRTWNVTLLDGAQMAALMSSDYERSIEAELNGTKFANVLNANANSANIADPKTAAYMEVYFAMISDMINSGKYGFLRHVPVIYKDALKRLRAVKIFKDQEKEYALEMAADLFFIVMMMLCAIIVKLDTNLQLQQLRDVYVLKYQHMSDLAWRILPKKTLTEVTMCYVSQSPQHAILMLCAWYWENSTEIRKQIHKSMQDDMKIQWKTDRIRLDEVEAYAKSKSFLTRVKSTTESSPSKWHHQA